MRGLVVALLASAHVHVPAAGLGGCSCFSPEMREQAARDALRTARVAVFGRVVAVGVDGSATIVVLESFKGPSKDVTVAVAPDAAECPDRAFSAGEDVLVLSFHDAVTACDQYPKDHFLVDAFRSTVSK